MQAEKENCRGLRSQVLEKHDLYIVSNRGPFSVQYDENSEVSFNRSGGGLVTALLGLANQVPSNWIAVAGSASDGAWDHGEVPLEEDGRSLQVRFIDPGEDTYHKHYQVISNPLLWFLQHSLWDFANAPTFTRSTWDAWNSGYVEVNRQIARAVIDQMESTQRGLVRERPALVMFQDYHLYLAPRFLRNWLRGVRGPRDHRLRMLRGRNQDVLTHFIHIPWPGPEDWGLLPKQMREGILDGLCAVDLVGLQTRGDALNFIRTCESLLPGARVNYRKGRVMFRGHTTWVRDFPISIDVDALENQRCTPEVQAFHDLLIEQLGDRKAIVRIDRTEPSKNIVRGFQAYEEMLELHPEHAGKVQFLALLVPSRLEVEEYQGYLDRIMAAAGQVNAHYGTSDWEPIRVLVGESYDRALALLRLYDVLLVNPVADGMNLVAKEGPTVNEKDGVIVLSERAGAHQQLGEHALVIAPCDVSATAEALHQALVMPADERREHARELKAAVRREDIYRWLCQQLDEVRSLTGSSGGS